MTRHPERSDTRLNLRAGELVEVRPLEEILATLDDRAELEALPFMPEMLKYCGKQLRVAARADKTCDRIERKGIRTMTDTVHLEGVRCDGSFHGGCEAACLIYWKEAWLKRARPERAAAAPEAESAEARARTLPGGPRVFDATLARGSEGPGDVRYSCQATEALRFTAPPGDAPITSYWRDAWCGNYRWRDIVRAYMVDWFNRFQARRGGTQYPVWGGQLATTPSETLDLQPGELVQIKTRQEICDTLDTEGRNRGLSFDREMLKFCGGTYKVLRRVNRIIDEPTGRMIQMKRDCIMLDGVVCEGRYHQLCRRAIYPYWREIWLRRAAAPGRAPARGGEGSFALFVLTSAFQLARRRLFGSRPAVRGQSPKRA